VSAIWEEEEDEGPLAAVEASAGGELDSARVETTPMSDGKVRPCSPSNDGHLFRW